MINAMYAYKNGSASARAVSDALDIFRIKHENSRFKGGAGKTVINWGSGKLPAEVKKCRVLNLNTTIATNKLKTFRALEGKEYCIPFTTDRTGAIAWLDDGHHVVCRTILTGHDGAGIVLAKTIEECVDAPLYTKYVKKDQEWRVHVMNGEAFFFQRKARKRDVPDANVNWQIRNHGNGFTFAHNEGRTPPPNLVAAAIDAVNTLGLDFGAVDCFHTARGKPFVLEVNTAPGVEGESINRYVEAFRRHYG